MSVMMRKALASLCLLLSSCTKAPRTTVALRGVTVVDVINGSLRPEQTVLIAGNRILTVGPTGDVRIPKEADLVDAAGAYLIPGLWDSHVHSVANIAWDMRVRSMAAADWHFPLYLAYGITGVRNMNDGTGDPTLELTNSVKRRLAQRIIRGPPRFLANGPSLDGDPTFASGGLAVTTTEQARAVVDTLAAHGADFVKVYENLSRDAYFAITDQARQRNIPVYGHVPFRVLPKEAAAAGQRTFEHELAMALGCSTRAVAEREAFGRALTGPSGSALIEETPLALFQHERRLYDTRDPARCAETIDAYRRNHVAEGADLVAYHHVVNAQQILADSASMRLVPPVIRRNWEEGTNSDIGRDIRTILGPIVPLQAANVRLLHEAGVTILAGTDVGIPGLIPGVSLHDDLALLVEAGLTALEALRAATINPARIFGLADSLGSIQPGKLADLVLLDANPLTDIRNTRRIRAVVADGTLYTRGDLDRVLTEGRPWMRALLQP